MRSSDLLAARTATWASEDRAALEALTAALRPSARHLADIVDWLEDIAARDGTRPARVLADPAVTTVLRGRGSAPDRLKRCKERLRRLRYPRLAAREAAIAEAIRALDLGAGARVTPPAGLEGGSFEICLGASSPDEVAALVARLGARLADGSVARLFALLE